MLRGSCSEQQQPPCERVAHGRLDRTRVHSYVRSVYVTYIRVCLDHGSPPPFSQSSTFGVATLLTYPRIRALYEGLSTPAPHADASGEPEKGAAAEVAAKNNFFSAPPPPRPPHYHDFGLVRTPLGTIIYRNHYIFYFSFIFSFVSI